MSNSYKRYAETLIAAVPKTVVTVPAATAAILKSIWIANNDASSTNITVTMTLAGVGTHYLVPTTALASKDRVDFLGGWDSNALILVLEEADTLVITSSLGNVYATVSALLVDRK